MIKQANKQKHHHTQPASEQHSNWLPSATARGLGALLPGKSSTRCTFEVGVHTDIIASTAPKGHSHGIQNGLSEREKRDEETAKGKTGSARTRIPAAVVHTTAVSLHSTGEWSRHSK